MRMLRLLLVVVAILLVAGAVTAGFTLREGKTTDRCTDSDAARCGTATDCNPERPACQEQMRNERLRRHCAENPRDERCR